MKVITIDGASATGKGTLAHKLQEKLGFAYLDTGALYRAVGWRMLQAGMDPENPAQAEQVARSLPPAEMAVLQNNPELRNEQVGSAASKVSAIPAVRKALFDFQRQFAAQPQGAILDGRDAGTVICPEADFKIFLTARDEIRAQRRFKELQSKGLCAILEDVLSDIQTRDKRDRERATSPLRPAEDAFVLDTSGLTPDDVFARVMRHIEGRAITKSPQSLLCRPTKEFLG